MAPILGRKGGVAPARCPDLICGPGLMGWSRRRVCGEDGGTPAACAFRGRWPTSDAELGIRASHPKPAGNSPGRGHPPRRRSRALAVALAVVPGTLAGWRGGRVRGRVQEADHVGFPSPGRGGQALGVPGVRHDPHLDGGR